MPLCHLQSNHPSGRFQGTCRDNGAHLGLSVVRGLGGESQQCLDVCLKAEPFCGVADSKSACGVVLSMVLQNDFLWEGGQCDLTALLKREMTGSFFIPFV